ncbi:MAG: FtsX-like permease family protein [Bacteroidetes bacterium]|jgi:putative ABC transport system permease protein|nr:FtsX-like permease family protein [Bacteroidota bacterium]MBT3751495.1 FtsX-like permease family protein [Bacteroidota bacterium]MBT4399205.1 FtsX-like permease family protein [Bacteroidota bacterium]MBT4412324.1 FtsX-like permease family protein [Bacteroidota bacterium]MBT7465455.1 FtsX-like permease family protein [Bacteroidota bacterium]
MKIKVFFRFFFRSLSRNIFQSTTQLIGLGIGMAVALLVYLYLVDELSFDRYHKNAKNIYVCGAGMTIGQANQTNQFTCNSDVGPLLKNYIPGIKEFVRIRQAGQVTVRFGDINFTESDFQYIDSSAFEVFSIPFIIGDPETALQAPHSIVLTETLASKYFGPENPLGEVIEIEDQGVFNITGVVEDLPDNTILNFTALLSYNTLFIAEPEQLSPGDLYGNMSSQLVFLFNEGYTDVDFNRHWKQYYNEYMAESDPIQYVSIIEPITEAHLNSTINPDFSDRNRRFFNGFLLIGIVVLLLAIVNYVNLCTTNYLNRAKEISMKKVVGSLRQQLRRQFLLESALNTVIATIIGLSLAELALSFSQLNNVLNKNLEINLFHNNQLVLGTIILIILVAILSGFYPAYIMSRTKPIQYLRGNFSQSRKGGRLRTGLVGLQFVLSATAVVTILLMHAQLKYVNKMDLGFEKDKLMAVEVRTQQLREQISSFRNEADNLAVVVSTTVANTYPGNGLSGNAFNWENNEGEMEIQAFGSMIVDPQAIETLGLKLTSGNDFPEWSASDTNGYFLVNEALAGHMGWKDPIGKRNQFGEVIGIVKDFNVQSTHTPIRPSFLFMSNAPQPFLLIRLTDRNQAAVTAIESAWNKFAPGSQFNYSFVEDDIAEYYQRDQNQQKLLVFLVIICIIISGLGLLGITANIISKRTKEVAIRKVFGASGSQIIYTLFKPVVLLMLIAFVLSIPIVLKIYSDWIESFAFRTNINVFWFIIADLGILIFALIISSYHGIQIARTEAIQKMRYE